MSLSRIIPPKIDPVTRFYIHGRYADSHLNKTFPNINPATNKLLSRVQEATKEDVDKAVESAKEGFAKWSQMSGTQRGRILHRAASLIREHKEELAAIEVLDIGKPIQEAIVVDIDSGKQQIFEEKLFRKESNIWFGL